MNKINFPYYSGYIRNPYVQGYISLEKFIEDHKNPSKKTMDILLDIDKARESGDKKKKDELKQSLVAFTPSVMINVNDSRGYKNITSFTGLMQIDLDKIPTEQEAIDLKEHIFHSHDEVICAYLSPSKRGIKALLRIKTPSMIGGVYSKEYAIGKFKAMHKAIEIDFEQYEYFDSATKNPILPLFASYDKDLLSRDWNEVKVWTKERHVSEKYNNLDGGNNFKYDYNENKATEMVVYAINNIVDNGHPQVRTASLILGSRVGAGYISRNDAYALMENLIKSNAYLQKGLNNYIKTSVWGIDQGINNPKYF